MHDIAGNLMYALIMLRQSALPIPNDYKKHGIRPEYVFRCVVNH